MMDQVFGANRLLNEIVWHYKTSSGAPTKWLHRNHDTIFRYANGPVADVTWHHPREPWPESTLKKWQKDEHGRIYRVQNKYGKRYYIDPAGKLMDDVWEMTLTSRSHERLGYPTQKPEKLLDRIIRASSEKGEVVLDPFCGCGTTMAVAQRLGREWIGIDISPTAIGIVERRLMKATNGAVQIRTPGMPETVEQLAKLKPFEFQNQIVQLVSGSHSPKKSGDMGIDGYSFMYHDPIQVKQSERVGRNTIDNFETAVERSGKDTGFIVAFSFTRGAYEEAARARAADKATIVLVTVAELLAATGALLGPTLRPPSREASQRRLTPDLLGIFGNHERELLDRPLLSRRKTRPSAEQLRDSARASAD